MATPRVLVLPIGHAVEIGPGDGPERQHGRVTSIQLRGSAAHPEVLYEVAWWDMGTRQTEWLPADEVDPCEEFTPLKIGFHAAPVLRPFPRRTDG